MLPANPKANYYAHKNEIDAAIARVLESGRYILGEEVAAFEHEFASYVGVRFGVGVGSGTEALHLAMLACGIGTHDEVVTVSHTAVASVAAIELCRANAVLVDTGQRTYTIDPDRIEEVITDRTKAIIPVHLYGCPADLDSVLNIAHRHGLRVIEDCAQSHGASYKNRRTGAWGDIAAFSFYSTKNLGAIGDGGMVVTNDPAFADQARLLREYGWRERYLSQVPGLNSRLDELQAAILRVKLRYLDEENRKRQALAHAYDELLSSTVMVPEIPLHSSHVYHQYVIRHKQRDALREFLQSRGMGTLVHYPVPIHLQQAYRNRLRCGSSMINTETIAKEVLSLPIYPEFEPDNVRQVAEAIVAFCHRAE